MYLGKGGIAAVGVILLLVNYKMFRVPACSHLLYQVAKMLANEIDCNYLGALVGVNALRWLCAYYYVGSLSNAILNGLLAMAVGLEVVLYQYHIDGFVGIVFRYFSVTQMMKVISYILTAREYALMGKDDHKMEEPICSPALIRFVLYPTMCYQMSYPRALEISYFNVAVYSGMILPMCAMCQWTAKIKCIEACRQMWRTPSIDAYIDVLIWSNIGWLCGFALVFVAIFGLQSELTRFGDKRFFGAWWDTTVSGYWRRWNSMVHTWVKRHVHKPLMKKNISHKASKAIIFIISGLVHEYILGNSVGRRGLGFLTMTAQIPLDALVHLIERKLKMSSHISSLIIFNAIGAPAVAMFASSAHC